MADREKEEEVPLDTLEKVVDAIEVDIADGGKAEFIGDTSDTGEKE